MTDIIILVVVGLIVGAATGYLRKARKSGRKCVGCPHAGSCSGSCGSCGGGCGCGGK